MRAVAVVRDLFFVARIRETARLAGTPLVFARTPEEITAAMGGPEPPSLVILDLTTSGWDYDALFAALARGAGRRRPLLIAVLQFEPSWLF